MKPVRRDAIFEQQDVSGTIDNDVLSIVPERKLIKVETSEKVYRRESFSRVSAPALADSAGSKLMRQGERAEAIQTIFSSTPANSRVIRPTTISRAGE